MGVEGEGQGFQAAGPERTTAEELRSAWLRLNVFFLSLDQDVKQPLERVPLNTVIVFKVMLVRFLCCKNFRNLKGVFFFFFFPSKTH